MPFRSILFFVVAVISQLTIGFFSIAAQTDEKGDFAVTNKIDYPQFLETNSINRLLFTNLNAEAVAGKIQINWQQQPEYSNSITTVFYSVDYLNHVSAREWRYVPMVNRGDLFNAVLPVDDVDIPLVYFVTAVINSTTNTSPLMACIPRKLGIEAPSRPFWNFLEGFEETTMNWRILNNYPDILPLRTNVEPKNGKAALCVALPGGRPSISVGTTRVRGWHITHYNAKGFAVWIRTGTGDGYVQFSLATHAWTEKQRVSQKPYKYPLTNEWRRIEVNFSDFQGIPLSEVDLLIFEFTGKGGTEFWIDDLSLTGAWIPEIE